jgi:hypothetical protein
MANAKLSISVIPGISASAVVQLNRMGITTIADLLAADYEQVAVLMDCFDDAAKVIKEAKKMVEGEAKPSGKSSRVQGAEAKFSTDLKAPVQARPPSAGYPGPKAGSKSHQAHHTDAPASGGSDLFERALRLTRELDQTSEPRRGVMARRLGVASRVLSSPGMDQEPVVAVLVESLENGSITPEMLVREFGPEIARVADEAMAIRAVPVSPSGKLPKYYLEMAAKASNAARRVCAGYQLWWMDQPASNAPSASPWYAKLVMEALEQGDPDPVVSAFADRLRRARAA